MSQKRFFSPLLYQLSYPANRSASCPAHLARVECRNATARVGHPTLVHAGNQL
jgi:hypothetical protein